MSQFILKRAVLLVLAAGMAAHAFSALAEPAIVRNGPMLQAAFKAAYGEAGQHHATLASNDDFLLTPSALVHTREGFFLVAEAYNNAGCHACFSGLAVTAFSDDHGQLGKVTGRLPFVSGGNGGETAASWTLDQRLTRYTALLVRTGWGGQGCESHGLRVVELAPAGAVVRLNYLALTQHDVDNDCCRIHFVGTIASVAAGDRFVMHYRGWTWPQGGRRAPLNETVSYRLKDGRFVPDKNVDDLMC